MAGAALSIEQNCGILAKESGAMIKWNLKYQAIAVHIISIGWLRAGWNSRMGRLLLRRWTAIMSAV